MLKAKGKSQKAKVLFGMPIAIGLRVTEEKEKGKSTLRQAQSDV